MNKAEIVNQFSNFLDLITTHGCDQFQTLSDRVDSTHTTYNNRLESVVVNLDEVEGKIGSMLNDIANLKDEFANYQKVSIVKNLNQQLHERNIEVGHLQKKVAKLESVASSAVGEVAADTVEEEEEVAADTVEEEEEVAAAADTVEEEEEGNDEEGVSIIEKMLKGPNDKKKRMYFVTDDEDRDIYDVDSEGDPSDDPVGKLVGKTGRAKWF